MQMQAKPWMNIRIPLWVAAAAFFAAAVGPAEAQMGSLRGRVVDMNGAPLQGVQVEAVMVRPDGRTPVRPVRRISGETEDEGGYIIPGLRSGNYLVTFKKDGYVEVQRVTNVPEGVADLGTIQMEEIPEGALTEEEAATANIAVESAQKAYEAGDYQTAIDEMKKFLEVDADNALAWYNLAAFYDKAGQKDEALATYEKVVELKPDMTDAWIAVATMYGDQKEFQKAMEAMGKAAELSQNSLHYFNYAAYATNAGDMETAEQAFRKVVELDPANATAHFQLGLMMIAQERNDDAIEHLEKYLEVDPEGANAEAAKDLLSKLKQS